MAFTFNKKIWEKKRPRSAHGSGVVKAIKLVDADCPAKPSTITTGDGFAKALAALDALDKAFDTANGKVKPKDDKNGILKLIKGWKGELTAYRAKVEAARTEHGITEGTKVASALYEKMLADLNVAIAACQKSVTSVKKDMKANKKINAPQLAKDQQTWRTVARDSLKYSTKAGKVDKIKFDGTIRALGVDPAAIPLPASAKLVKKRVPILEASLDELSELYDEAVDATTVPDGKYAKPVKALLAKYKTVRATHKRQSADAKKVAAIVKQVAGLAKAGESADTSRLVTLLGKAMDAYLKVDGASLELQYSTRNSAGKIQKEYKELVSGGDFPMELNDRIRDQRASVFDAYKTVSSPLSVARNQLGRVVKYLMAAGGTTASQVEPLAQDFESRVKALSSKFGRGG